VLGAADKRARSGEESEVRFGKQELVLDSMLMSSKLALHHERQVNHL